MRLFYASCQCRLLLEPPTLPKLNPPNQPDKPSPGIQAAAIAPGSVAVHTFPDKIPDHWDPQRTLVVYPAADAVTLDTLAPEDLAGVERCVLLDSRWNNTTRVRMRVEVLFKKGRQRSLPSSYHQSKPISH